MGTRKTTCRKSLLSMGIGKRPNIEQEISNDEERNSIDLQKQIERKPFFTSTLEILLFSVFRPLSSIFFLL
jgi:hypothetical protein